MTEALRRTLLAAITILSVLWLLDVPVRAGTAIIAEQFYLVIAGLAGPDLKVEIEGEAVGKE